MFINNHNEGATTPSLNIEKLDSKQSRMTPIANIELDPIDFGGNYNDIPSEGDTKLDQRIKNKGKLFSFHYLIIYIELSRNSPNPEFPIKVLPIKANIRKDKNDNNFIDQMHKRIAPKVTHNKKLSSNFGIGSSKGKNSKQTPHRTKISLSNSPVANLGKKPE